MPYTHTTLMYRNPSIPHIHHTCPYHEHDHTCTPHTYVPICTDRTPFWQHVHICTSTSHTYTSPPYVHHMQTGACYTPHTWSHTPPTCWNFSSVYIYNTCMYYHTHRHNLIYIPKTHITSTHRMFLAMSPCKSVPIWGPGCLFHRVQQCGDRKHKLRQ